jgi:lipopolysaccharide/colanic/teichoic acid biosynthesis glycosyltransferase
MTSIYVRLWKPCLDRLAGVILVLVTAPFLALIALVIRMNLGPGVIFRQQRIGRHGVAFDVLKFRTMLPDRRRADVPISFPDRRRTHKSGADPRHTPVGRFLRRWSLDELPQLFNVARGQMSLIGPRPELASVVARYQPWQHERHDVKPGLTGLWQVTARGDGPMELRTDLDIEYARRICFALDVRILAATATGSSPSGGSDHEGGRDRRRRIPRLPPVRGTHRRRPRGCLRR